MRPEPSLYPCRRARGHQGDLLESSANSHLDMEQRLAAGIVLPSELNLARAQGRGSEAARSRGQRERGREIDPELPAVGHVRCREEQQVASDGEVCGI